MSFPHEVIRKLDETSERVCAVCGFTEGPFQRHSVTGLHLVRSENGFRVTSAPSGHFTLVGRTLGFNSNPFGINSFDDGMDVCYLCHLRIHQLAGRSSMLNGGRYNQVPASILSEVSINALVLGEAYFDFFGVSG